MLFYFSKSMIIVNEIGRCLDAIAADLKFSALLPVEHLLFFFSFEGMEGLQLALFADNPHLVPEGLQGGNTHVPCVVGFVVRTSEEAQTQVSNDIRDEIQQSNAQGASGNPSDDCYFISQEGGPLGRNPAQPDYPVANGNVWAGRYIIVHEYSGEYLGESIHPYYSDEKSWLFTTNWANQPDKSEKFQWFVTRSAGMGSDYRITNVLTGHAVQDSCDDFNNVGDHVVIATSDTTEPFCKWYIHDDLDGVYSIWNVSSGFVLGASKKEFNNRGDHHIMSSPEAKDSPSVKKWKWMFVELPPEGQDS